MASTNEPTLPEEGKKETAGAENPELKQSAAAGAGPDAAAEASPPAAKKPLWQRLLPVGVIAVLLILFFATGLNKYFNFQFFTENKAAMDAWIADNTILAVLLFIAVYAGAVAISFPGATILTIVGGFLLGLWKGTIGVVLGATIGAFIIFMLASTVFGDSLRSKAGGFVKKMEEGFREDELSYMFLLRLVPAFPFFAVNIAAGLLGVKPRNYLIGTFFGIIPGTFVYVSIGNAIAAGAASLEDTGLLAVFSQPSVLLPFAGLAILGALPILIKRFSKKKPPAAQA